MEEKKKKKRKKKIPNNTDPSHEDKVRGRAEGNIVDL